MRKALCFISQHGPATDEVRWEAIGCYSPYTSAVEIAALLEAADLAPEPELADYLRETADVWNDSIERWTYATGTDLAKQVGVEGYYIRMAPKCGEGAPGVEGRIEQNHVSEKALVPAAGIVSIGHRASVRLGRGRAVARCVGVCVH